MLRQTLYIIFYSPRKVLHLIPRQPSSALALTFVLVIFTSNPDNGIGVPDRPPTKLRSFRALYT